MPRVPAGPLVRNWRHRVGCLRGESVPGSKGEIMTHNPRAGVAAHPHSGVSTSCGRRPPFFPLSPILPFSLSAFIVCVLLVPSRAPAQRADEPLVEKVRKSIDKGVQFLRDQEGGRGHWEVNVEGQGYRGGWTSLAILALLN